MLSSRREERLGNVIRSNAEQSLNVLHSNFGSPSLQSVTIPSSLVEIGNYVFKSCINLREVVCIEWLPKIERNTFNDCPTRITFPNLSSRLEDIIRLGN